MHADHYATEKQRKNAMKEKEANLKQQQLNFEELLKHYPKKFEISKALNNDRTFPANMPAKVSAKLESIHDFQKRRMAPAASNRKAEAKQSYYKRHVDTSPSSFRPNLMSAAETVRLTSAAGAPSISVGEDPRSVASSNRARELHSQAGDARKLTLSSAKGDGRYASTVRGTTANTTVIGVELCTPPASTRKDIQSLQMAEVYTRMSTDPD